MAAVSQLRLDHDRSLSFRDYGDPNGFPVLFFHGTHSAGIERDLYGGDEVAAASGTRVISPDRPGAGDSTGVARELSAVGRPTSRR